MDRLVAERRGRIAKWPGTVCSRSSRVLVIGSEFGGDFGPFLSLDGALLDVGLAVDHSQVGKPPEGQQFGPGVSRCSRHTL